MHEMSAPEVRRPGMMPLLAATVFASASTVHFQTPMLGRFAAEFDRLLEKHLSLNTNLSYLAQTSLSPQVCERTDPDEAMCDTPQDDVVYATDITTTIEISLFDKDCKALLAVQLD